MKFSYKVILLLLAFGESNATGLLIKADASCKLWWTGSTYKVMQQEPAPELRGKISIKAAKNEFESFQLILLPMMDMGEISVSVTGLSHSKGGIIPAENITFRKVEYVHITKPSGIRHQGGWYPDPLPLLEQPFAARAGVNTPLLVTVKVPGNALPGVYTMQISLKSGDWKTTVPAELKVWDFALPEVPHIRSSFGLYSDLIRNYHNLETVDELKHVLDLYFQAFRDYRISPQHFNDQHPMRLRVKGAWWNGGTFDPDTVFEGKYSFQVTGSNPGTHAELIQVNPQKPYWLKWQAKTLVEEQQYLVTVKSYGADKKVIPWHLQGMFYPGSTRWRPDSLFLDPVNPLVYDDMILSRPMPGNTKYISVQLHSVVPDEGGGRRGTAWFDQVRLSDPETGDNLLPTGNFEQDINELNVKLD